MDLDSTINLGISVEDENLTHTYIEQQGGYQYLKDLEADGILIKVGDPVYIEKGEEDSIYEDIHIPVKFNSKKVSVYAGKQIPLLKKDYPQINYLEDEQSLEYKGEKISFSGAKIQIEILDLLYSHQGEPLHVARFSNVLETSNYSRTVKDSVRSINKKIDDKWGVKDHIYKTGCGTEAKYRVL